MNGIFPTEEIVLSQFPKSVIEQANAAARIKPASLLARRLDLRGKMIFSFSETPDTPAEFAFSLSRSGMGWQLGLHISDVCEYVCEGSPLDIEARRRLATISNGFIKSDMLPEKLSKEVCDLSVGDDKLTVSVLLDISNKGELISVSCEESVIRVAQHCVYKEIDELLYANDASSVFPLRNKYGSLFNTIVDMFELAAIFCGKRREKGGLDCAVFRRVYDRDENGRVVAFRRESEPDTRAMIREIGYFSAEAIGNYMHGKNLPCIFLGTDGVPVETLDYLGELVGESDKNGTPAARTADIANKAKGTPYYGFICDTISASLPCQIFSDKPIMSSLCVSDKVLSLFHPTMQYADLLTQRMLKTSIAAAGNPRNLNLNRYKKAVKDAAEAATKAKMYVCSMTRKFSNVAALEYIEHSEENAFVGFPLLKDESGCVPVMLECGLLAVVPSEYAKSFDFEPAKPYNFEVIALGTDFEASVVKPIAE